MKVDVEGLRMEIVLSQPSSSECDTSPQRAAVDTGSEEPGTPTQSPAISKGSGPEAQQAETQMHGGIFPFEASTDGLLDKNVTSTKQEEPALLCQPDVGVDDEEKEATTTIKPADVRKFVSTTGASRTRRSSRSSTQAALLTCGARGENRAHEFLHLLYIQGPWAVRIVVDAVFKSPRTLVHPEVLKPSARIPDA